MASTVDPTLGGTLLGAGEIDSDEMYTALEAIRQELSALQTAVLDIAFTAISDVPSTYASRAKQTLQVKSSEDGLEYINHTGHQDPGRDTVGDAAKTLTVGTAKQLQEWATTLTANRTCTLPASNRYAGLNYRIQRTAGGDFNLTVSGLDSGGAGTYALRQNEVLDVYFDGTDWKIAAFARLSRVIDMRDALLKNAKIEAYTEAETAVSPSAGVVTLDCSTAQVFVVTASANITSWTLTNVDSSAHTSFFVYLTQDATGGRTVAWTFTVNGGAATALWPGGAAPTVSSAASAQDCYQFLIRSADLTKVRGFPAGQAFA